MADSDNLVFTTPPPRGAQPLTFDPVEAIAHLTRADRRLARLIARAGPFTLRPEKIQSPFQALLRAIIYQQLSGKAAATIFGRVAAQFPHRRGIQPEAIVSASDESLRQAGLSRAKVLAVKDLAAKTLDGTVPTFARLRKMDDDEIVTRLVSVRGVGRWTVEMLLMFRLGRPDVLPVADLGVRRGFMLTYAKPELPMPAELTRHAERWRPFRSVASWYMWRAVDLERRSKLVLPG
ncbi:MAG TPA: DNA-3-methyladenine glycosylase [Pirellulales bacterium]|nr:DNA-3-methyladenine glycosylase [Pirellulales bacterium]